MIMMIIVVICDHDSDDTSYIAIITQMSLCVVGLVPA